MLKAGVERDPDAICAETVQLVRDRIGPVAASGATGFDPAVLAAVRRVALEHGLPVLPLS